MRPGIIITDVTGVKGCIVYDIQSILRPDVEFIAAHPMAGRERSGVEYSDDRVFIGANFIVTPTEKIQERRLSFASRSARSWDLQEFPKYHRSFTTR